LLGLAMIYILKFISGIFHVKSFAAVCFDTVFF